MAVTTTFTKMLNNITLYRAAAINFRPYSSLNHQAVELENVEPSKRVENGIPFLFLPHTVKKAYTVKHGVSTYLPKVFDKYKWLTKTLSTPFIPDNILSFEESDRMNDFKKIFHDSLAQTVAYQKLPKNREARQHTQERMIALCSNLLRISMIHLNEKKHLLTDNFMMLNETKLETHWVRNFKFYQTQLSPAFTLKSKNALPVIEEPMEINPNDIAKIPGPYDTYDMNLYRHPVVHLTNRACMDNSRFSPVQHCHTSIVINNRLRTDEQLYTAGMFTMFAQLAAQAQSNSELQGTELTSPLATQCIVTNGHTIVFMMYQLNTLNMLTDKGLWNRCWYMPVEEMFERNNSDSHDMVYEEALRNDPLSGFNEKGLNWQKEKSSQLFDIDQKTGSSPSEFNHIHSLAKDYQSIIHFTTGDNINGHGSRCPAIFFEPGTTALLMASTISGHSNYVFGFETIPVYDVASICIEQKSISLTDNYAVRIYEINTVANYMFCGLWFRPLVLYTSYFLYKKLVYKKPEAQKIQILRNF